MLRDGFRTCGLGTLTVIADRDGNKGVVCVDASAAKKD